MSIISKSRSGIDHVTVESTFGSVRGFVNKDYPNVAQFLGIPFAEPPVGARRWLPPVRKAPVDHADATAFGPSPWQWWGAEEGVYSTEVPEFRIQDGMSEDCLSLCIWAPKEAAESPAAYKLPVIIFITGGAFLVGGSTIPYQNPTPWVETSQRHIVVVINYRLGIFGFPNAAGIALKKRNLGLMDQRAGLEWVQKHIASFGGDPGRLTHFGQSAGGRSIDMHTFQYPDNPIVSQLIMNSGTALPPLPDPDPECTHFRFVANALGFSGGDAAAELAFMRRQPAEKLIGLISSHYYTKWAPYLSFRPIVDNVSVFADFVKRAEEGNFAKLPAIIGTTNDEGNSLVLFSPYGIDAAAAETITTNYFLKPSANMARARSAHAPTFRFLFKDFAPPGTSSFPNIAPRPWMRAYHSGDMPLVFGTHAWFRGPSTELEEKVSRAWQELYVVFAEDGPDGLRRLGWADVSEDKGVVLGCGDRGWETVRLHEIDN